jgi:tetratricopeptide (TPR) repeat protein
MAIARNERCPCGSGRKFKHCCGSAGASPTGAPAGPPDLSALTALVNDGHLAQAEARARAHLEQQPEAGALWKVLSVAQLRQGKDALAALERAAQLLPADAEAHANLGAVLLERQAWESALESLRRALKLEPRNPQVLLDAAQAQRALGRPLEAVTLYHWALQLEPRRREAHNDLGNAYLELGKAQEAVQCYRYALQLKPDDPLVLCNLANALRQLGQFPEAISLSRRSLLLAPTLAMARNNLGLCLAAQGGAAEAIDCFQEALRLEPRYLEAYCNLGMIYAQQGARREAAAAYARALELSPNRRDILCSLGQVLFDSRRVQEATECYRRALELDPKLLDAHLGLAKAQRVQGLYAEAELSCQAALKLQPDSVAALHVLGELRIDRGEFLEAQQLFTRIIALAPQYVPAYVGIASHRRMSAEDGPWRSAVEQLLHGPLPLGEETSLRFALGKYFDDTGQYEAAFEQYRRANECSKRLSGSYDAAKLSAQIDRTLRLCRSGALSAGASDSQRPVFIIGMPRSGTSLAEQILASHPAAFGAGELHFWNKAFERLDSAAQQPAQLAGDVAEVARDYLEYLGTHAGDAARVIDKMPANFLFAGVIHAVFPRARIIHMQRHPLDTCVSIYFQNFYNVSPYANDLQNLAHYYREYLRISAAWRASLPSHSLLEVPYEALVMEPEKWTRRMLEFLDLPWDERCLQFHRTERVVITASRWQVRQQLSTASIGRWRHYATHLDALAGLAELDPGAAQRA